MARKTILITGASRGLGKSLALKFASDGYNLIIHGRDQERLLALKQEIIAQNVDCYIVIGDIADEKTIDELAECSKKANIDILINNAGMYLKKPLEEMMTNELKRVMDVNLIAPILLTQKIYRYLFKKASGLIININSFAGKNFSKHETIYCASKHGLKGFMGAFQYEALENNVQIINIFSGAMDTDMTADRSDRSKFIQTEEVAELINGLVRDYKNMRVSEVDIFRKNY